MRAVRMVANGGPEVLTLEEVPAPRAPRGDELSVRVRASSINGSDLALRRGGLGPSPWSRLPLTPGFDLVGEVTACGPAVTAFRPGDRVAALLGHGGGAHAEQVLVRQRRAARVPSGLVDLDAATVPLAGLTALQALYDRGALSGRARGAHVLVLGASGGIGAFAVQLGVLAGARVTAVTSTGGLEQVRSWGAAEVVDRTTTSLDALDDRFDIVLDGHGAGDVKQQLALTRPGGTVVSVRPLSGDAWRAVSGRLHRGAAAYDVVMTRPSSQDLAHLLHLVGTGAVSAPLDVMFPVDDVRAAHERAEGGARGKVVLSFP